MKLRITVNGNAYDVDVEVLDAGGVPVPSAPAATPLPPPVASPPPAPAAPPTPAPAPPSSAGGNDVTSPIAGNVLSVKVQPGDTVEMNQTLLVLEAMKMESNVASPRAGTVAEVLVSAGDAVTAGQVLVKF
ncbi:MAG: biotin/lipoyl-containing protein [Planctomycetota bacterium]